MMRHGMADLLRTQIARSPWRWACCCLEWPTPPYARRPASMSLHKRYPPSTHAELSFIIWICCWIAATDVCVLTDLAQYAMQSAYDLHTPYTRSAHHSFNLGVVLHTSAIYS